jgi:dienelactone hydrolase
MSFAAEPDDRIEAYLFVPAGRGAGPFPAVLCLHQTTEIGKDEPAGLGDNPDLQYARELAERGFVTLAPDYWRFGERAGRFNPYEHGYVSGTMKGIHDHRRSLDLLASLPEVDGARIGAIGHSLGGHNALFLAVFDERVQAVVTSCGFNSFYHYAASEYGHGDLRGWSTPTYMPRIKTHYGEDPNRMPFDWTEALAAIAPRPVFINAPTEDENFALAGVEACVRAARPVYERLGAGAGLTMETPKAGHAFPPDIRERAYAFFARALKK